MESGYNLKNIPKGASGLVRLNGISSDYLFALDQFIGEYHKKIRDEHGKPKNMPHEISEPIFKKGAALRQVAVESGLEDAFLSVANASKLFLSDLG